MAIHFLPSKEFYNDPNPLVINGDTQKKIIRVARLLFSIIIFPIAIYNLLHVLVGKIIIPISSPYFLPEYVRCELKTCIEKLTDPELVDKNTDFRCKRFTVKIDGYQVDGCLLSNSLAKNGRWVLRSNGNAESYESILDLTAETPIQHSPTDAPFINFLKALNANGVVFNPPGVINSSGFPNKYITVKTYQTILKFLENELAAEEIIGYGFSLGGGIQGEALRSHNLQEHIRYVFIKDRTFSSLSQAATSITHEFFGCLIKLIGWNMDSVASSKKLQATEIILQKACGKNNFQKITNREDLVTDGVIPKEASLAFELLKIQPLKNKHILKINAFHNACLEDISPLVQIVNEALEVREIAKMPVKELRMQDSNLRPID